MIRPQFSLHCDTRRILHETFERVSVRENPQMTRERKKGCTETLSEATSNAYPRSELKTARERMPHNKFDLESVCETQS
jgi:hypothetical protein